MVPTTTAATEFGTQLDRYLKTAELSLRDFGEMVGYSHTLIGWIVKGIKTPPPADLPRWAKLLKVPAPEVQGFIELGRSARARGKADVGEYVAQMERTVAEVASVHADIALVLASIMSHPSMKPHQGELKRLLEKIRDLQGRL